MPKDDEDRLVQMNVQVPNWVRQRLRERYVRTGEGQSAFARRAIIRLLEEEDEQRPKDDRDRCGSHSGHSAHRCDGCVRDKRRKEG